MEDVGKADLSEFKARGDLAKENLALLNQYSKKEKLFSMHESLYSAIKEANKQNSRYVVAVGYDVQRPGSYEFDMSFKYLVFESFYFFEECYYKLWEDGKRHFFEVVRLDIRDVGRQRTGSDPPNRLFFDIDYKYFSWKEGQHFHPTFHQDMEEVITATIKECYPKREIPPLEYVWMDSSRPEKASFHLVVKGLLFDEFRDHFPLIYWAICYNLAKSEKFKYIDFEEWKRGEVLDKMMLSTTIFRMVDSCKPGSEHTLRFMNQEKKYGLRDSLVRVHCVLHPDIWRCPTLTRGDFHFPDREIMDRAFGLKKRGFCYESDEPSDDVLMEGFKKCQEDLEWFRVFKPSAFFCGRLYLKNVPHQAFFCPQCKVARHAKSPCFITVLGNEGRVIFKCRLERGKLIAQLRETPRQQVLKAIDSENGGGTTQIFEKITTGEDVGGAEAFCLLAKDSFFVIVDNEKYVIYGWREDKRLWGKFPVREFLLVISKVIVGFLEKMREDFYKLKSVTEDKGLVAQYENGISKATSHIQRYKTKHTLDTVHALVTGQLIDNERFMLLDACPYLLSVAGGEVVDFREKKVRKREKGDYLTYEAPTKYTGKISPIFEKFMNDIFLDDGIMVEFMRRALGYSITGYTEEHKMFIMRGDTRNGKSALLKLIKLTLGKGVFVTGNNSVIEDLANDGRPTNSLFRIKDARIVNLPETESNAKLVESAIKRMTGADSITCRANFQGEIEFDPAFKIWIATNYNPDTSLSEAILTRFVFIEFPCRFTENPRLSNERLLDPRLHEKFATEEFRESCLSWLVSGANHYCEERKLTYPKVIVDNLNAYVQEKRNEIDSFLDDKYFIELPADFNIAQLSDRGVREKLPFVQFTNLYNEYKSFCIKCGAVAKDMKYFGKYLKETRDPIIPWYKVKGDKIFFYGLRKKGASLLL